MSEIWKVWRDGIYEVSSLGRVRRVVGGKGTRVGLRKPCAESTGYLNVSVCIAGERRTVRIHTMVAECFLRPVDGRRFVNHVDGDKHNNSATNLEWVTHAENMAHAGRAGVMPSGSAHWTRRAA